MTHLKTNRILAVSFFLMGPLTLSASAPAAQLKIDPKLAKVTATCKKSPQNQSTVYFFKQWHLATGIDTKADRKPHAQGANLESIYLQLVNWVKSSKVATVIAEGCSSILDESSSVRINGWSISELIKERSSAGFSKIETSVPLKLKAKFGSVLKAKCGDNEALIREQLLQFSDARGDVGYLTRLEQYQNDSTKLKPYLTDVIGMLKLPENSDWAHVRDALRQDLKKTVEAIRTTIEKRNQSLVEAIEKDKPGAIAVVYGGMHANGVKALLEAKGMNCQVLEPTGYQSDEEQLLEQLDVALKKL
jgi:hypothetical protein